MAAGININLVTPEKLYLSTEVEMVVAPGVLGDFGALSGHAPFVTLLRPGTIDITSANGEHKKIFVSSGFVEVNNQHCTILAEELYDLSELNSSTVQQELDQLIFDRDHAETEREKEKLSDKISITEIKLAATKSNH
jgi:F-type H+-transporting ATPase subunit epsilon